jgi:hypothetical protein
MRIQRQKINASLWTLVNIVMIAFLVAGCAVPTPTPPPPTATLPPPSPTPTSTITPTPPPTATPLPTPTLDYQATLAANKTATAEAEMAAVQKDADKFGITLDPGKLVWKDSDTTLLNIEHYSSYRFAPAVDTPVKDFVIHTLVQWDSTSGLAGCGILFRTDEDLNQGAHYDFLLTRLQGSPHWVLNYFKFQKVQTNISGVPVYAKEINDALNSTNELMVVAKGSDLTVYINGKKMGNYKNDKLTEGLVGFSVWQESGTTNCEFSNNWLYVLD